MTFRSFFNIHWRHQHQHHFSKPRWNPEGLQHPCVTTVEENDGQHSFWTRHTSEIYQSISGFLWQPMLNSSTLILTNLEHRWYQFEIVAYKAWILQKPRRIGYWFYGIKKKIWRIGFARSWLMQMKLALNRRKSYLAKHSNSRIKDLFIWRNVMHSTFTTDAWVVHNVLQTLINTRISGMSIQGSRPN